MTMTPIYSILCLILTTFFAIMSTSLATGRRTYIIHMDNSKVLEQLENFNKKPQEWYEEILEFTRISVDEDDIDTLAPELLYTYDTTLIGFAAKLTTNQYQFLVDLDGVLHIARDGARKIQTTYSPQFLGLELGRAGLWKSSSRQKPAFDVIIGVIDTGIWPEHASFSDKGYLEIPSRWKGSCQEGVNFSTSNCNKKLIGAKFFFKGYEAMYGKLNDTVDIRSARDTDGHGTHTASTAAGSPVSDASLFGMARGVARGISFTSRIAAYKVCWDESCTVTDMLAAIDQAVADGVDVLSLSIQADPTPYYQDSPIIAAFSASQKGVFVSFVAGNFGPFPSTVGNVAPWVMTIAASFLDRNFLCKVQLSNGKTFIGASIFSINQKNTKKLPLVYKETAGAKREAEYCLPGSLSSSLVKGKIVVCMRGKIGRVDKGFVVKLAGAAGMILLNKPSSGEELVADPHFLPATLLGASDARSIRSYLKQDKNLTASIYFLGTRYGARAPIMAAFSSRGPSAVDPHIIKPDITAPGMNILAAWPPISPITQLDYDKRRAHFNILSGTSMSCPHVSGIAALIKSIHKDWSPAAIKSAMMTTTYTHDNKKLFISDTFLTKSTKIATPFAYGSGHVNPERASDPGLVYDISGEDYLLYLCSISYTNAQVSIVARRKYRCQSNKGSKSILHPGDLNYPSFAVIFDATKIGQTAITHKRTATNVGSPIISYKVFVDAPNGVEVSVKPSVLNFNKLGEKQSYKVTFTYSRSNITSASGVSSFGSLQWVGGNYTVRSPIVVTWR